MVLTEDIPGEIANGWAVDSKNLLICFTRNNKVFKK